LIAINECGANVTIVDIATLSFSGMVQSNLTMTNSTTYNKNLTWTPTAAQIGYQVMCAMAFDR
jgi:nitrogen fixation protein FixH